MRFALLGLYNSGSSALAGMLHRLGANLGPPFARDPQSTAPIRRYESGDLGHSLRTWWNEPDIEERVPRDERVSWLVDWAGRHWLGSPAPLGAKHPLLALCTADIIAAWGADTRFLWSYRPLAESIAGLERRGWFAGRETTLQERLWSALRDFEAGHRGVVRLEWSRARADPHRTARELADFAGLEPTAGQFRAAADFVIDHRAT